MTLDEAKLVARVVGTADSACPHCVGSLVKYLNETFPDFLWTQTREESSYSKRTKYGEFNVRFLVVNVEAAEGWKEPAK